MKSQKRISEQNEKNNRQTKMCRKAGRTYVRYVQLLTIISLIKRTRNLSPLTSTYIRTYLQTYVIAYIYAKMTEKALTDDMPVAINTTIFLKTKSYKNYIANTMTTILFLH